MRAHNSFLIIKRGARAYTREKRKYRQLRGEPKNGELTMKL